MRIELSNIRNICYSPDLLVLTDDDANEFIFDNVDYDEIERIVKTLINALPNQVKEVLIEDLCEGKNRKNYSETASQ